VKLEEFVDDYYSVENFQAAYKRVVVLLGDKSFWTGVDIGSASSSTSSEKTCWAAKKK
jgi:hypothetical protein